MASWRIGTRRHSTTPARPTPLPAAPERVGPRVARIVQHLQDERVLQRLPVQFALARPAAEAAGEVQPLAAEVPHRGGGGAGAGEDGTVGEPGALPFAQADGGAGVRDSEASRS